MSIKAATRIAIVGVAIALLMAIAIPFVSAYLFDDYARTYALTQSQIATRLNWYRGIQAAVGQGSILLFLIVLASKQKEQS